MGNTLSKEDIVQMQEIFDKIMDIPCPELDISNFNGITDYIDFILQSDVTNPIMKGSDLVGRNFIVWKAQVIIDKSDDKSPSTYNTFTTFFKRYSEPTSCVYHTCGHDGKILFDTVGGATLEQMSFLYTLLSTRTSELNYYQAEKLKLSYENLEGFETRQNWIFKINI